MILQALGINRAFSSFDLILLAAEDSIRSEYEASVFLSARSCHSIVLFGGKVAPETWCDWSSPIWKPCWKLFYGCR